MSEHKFSPYRIGLADRVIDSEEFAESYANYGARKIGEQNLARLASLSVTGAGDVRSSSAVLDIPIWPLLRSGKDLVGLPVRITRLPEGQTNSRDIFFWPKQVIIDGDDVVLGPETESEIHTTVYDPTLITIAGFQRLQDIRPVGSGHTSPAGLYWRVALLTARHSQYNEKTFVAGVVSAARENGNMVSPYAKNINGLADFRAQPKKVRNKLKSRR